MTTSSADREGVLQELERVLRLDDPYVEKPDDVQVDVGGACFLNQHRVCGPDCAAFGSPEAPTASERCMLLNGLSQGLVLLEHLARPPRAASMAPPPPPDPFGPRRRA